MAGEIVLTVIGNLTGDPELRFTPSGAAVANFTVANNPKTFDRQANEWKDGETVFLRCAIWREAAENVAESLHRGDRVIVSGRLKSRSWDDKETGQKRTVIEMDVDEVGPSLRYANAKVTKTQRGGGEQGGGGFGVQQGQGAPQGGVYGPQTGQGGYSGQGGGFGAQGGSQAPQGGYGAGQPPADPWATGGGSGQGSGWGNGPSYDEPPFAAPAATFGEMHEEMTR